MSKEIAHIIDELSKKDPIDLYEVKTVQLITGITGKAIDTFEINVMLFATRDKALDYAFHEFKQFCRMYYKFRNDLPEAVLKPEKNLTGHYFGISSGRWPDIEVETKKVTLRTDRDMIFCTKIIR